MQKRTNENMAACQNKNSRSIRHGHMHVDTYKIGNESRKKYRYLNAHLQTLNSKVSMSPRLPSIGQRSLSQSGV